MEATGRFSASSRSRNNSPRCSDSSWKWWYSGENKSWRNFSPSEIGNVFASTSTTNAPMDKQMVQADSVHQLGLESILYAVLIAGWCFTKWWRFNLVAIGSNFCVPRFFVLACNTTTSNPIDKRRPQADSAHEIGPKTTLQGVLIVVESVGTVGKTRAGGIFHSHPILPVPQQPALLWTNGCYRRIQRIK